MKLKILLYFVTGAAVISLTSCFGVRYLWFRESYEEILFTIFSGSIVSKPPLATWYLKFGDGAPPASVLHRLRSRGLLVEPSIDDEFPLVAVDSIQLTSSSSCWADYGWRTGSLTGSGSRLWLRKDAGRWKVVDVEWLYEI